MSDKVTIEKKLDESLTKMFRKEVFVPSEQLMSSQQRILLIDGM